MPAPTAFSRSKDLQTKARKMYEQDKMSFKDIGPIVGCSKDVVQRFAAKSGWMMHTKRRFSRPFRFTDEQKSEIVKMYLGGLSGREIARRFDLAKDGAVYRVLKAAGVDTRTKNMLDDCLPWWQPATVARALTRQVYLANEELINPLGLKRGVGHYALDHVYSIHAAATNRSGLSNPLNVFEVCHPANLKLIPFEDNRRKWTKRGVTAAVLRKQIDEWNLRYGEPYLCRATPTVDRFLEQHRFDNYGRQLEDLSRSELLRGYYHKSDWQ